MTTLHPHWENDDVRPSADAGKSASTPEAAAAFATLQQQSVSRKPAALVGIFLALAIVGFLLGPFGGAPTTAQVRTIYKIVLTDGGAIPSEVIVGPEDEVQFVNLLEQGQIISFDIPTTEGITETPEIAFQDSFSITIAADAAPGMYSFGSTGNPLLQGTFFIETPGMENAGDFEEEGTMEDFPAVTSGNDESDDAETFAAFASSASSFDDSTPEFPAAPEEPEPAVTPSASLPQNPFTVQYGQIHGVQPPPPYAGQILHSGAPLARQQPATGAGHWVVIGASIVVLLVVTRRAFRKV